MNIMENGTVRTVAEKIREIRTGNRMMMGKDLNLTLSFFRRNQPEKKCGVVKVNGNLDFSLLDLGVCIAAAIALFRIIRGVRSLVKFVRRRRKKHAAKKH